MPQGWRPYSQSDVELERYSQGTKTIIPSLKLKDMLEHMINLPMPKLESGSSLPWSLPDESPGWSENEGD